MSQEIQEIAELIKQRSEKFGAYMKFLSVAAASNKVADDTSEEDLMEHLTEMPGADDLKQQLIDGDISVIIFTSFSLNELAFSDRVQDPIKVRDEDEFNIVAPSEYDILQEKIRERLEKGLDPFSDD